VLVVPDRRSDGTNLLSLPASVGFRFRYGPGSAAAHVDEAERLGLPSVVVDDPDLAWDVDLPDDLPGDLPNDTAPGGTL
jgi:2-phospho-L-lactate guanylyltransferase